MSGYLEYVFFNFTSDKVLKDKSNILRLITRIVEESGFRVEIPFSNEYPPQHFVENTPEELSQAWDEAIARGHYGASIGLWNSKEFALSVGVNFAHYRQLDVMVNSGNISDLMPSNYENVRLLVQVCESVYSVLHPEYGFGLISPNIHPINEPDKGDVTIQAIYDYNFFGPRLMQKLGREKVLSIPTWRTLQFDDGGVLLEMSPNPIADWKPYTSNYQKAAEILGVEKFYQGG